MRYKPALIVGNEAACLPYAHACRFLPDDPTADDGVVVVKFG